MHDACRGFTPDTGGGVKGMALWVEMPPRTETSGWDESQTSVNTEVWGGEGVEVCSRGAASVWGLKAESLAPSNDGVWRGKVAGCDWVKRGRRGECERKALQETAHTDSLNFHPTSCSECYVIVSCRLKPIQWTDMCSDMWLNLTVWCSKVVHSCILCFLRRLLSTCRFCEGVWIRRWCQMNTHCALGTNNMSRLRRAYNGKSLAPLRDWRKHCLKLIFSF